MAVVNRWTGHQKKCNQPGLVIWSRPATNKRRCWLPDKEPKKKGGASPAKAATRRMAVVNRWTGIPKEV